MENKKKLIILILGLIIILGIAIPLCFFYRHCQEKETIYPLNTISNLSAPTSSIDIMSDEDKDKLGLYHLAAFQVITRNASGTPTSYKIIGGQDTKPLKLELMSQEEKVELRINPDLKIQIVEKDSQGKTIKYRVIRKDSNIITEF